MQAEIYPSSLTFLYIWNNALMSLKTYSNYSERKDQMWVELTDESTTSTSCSFNLSTFTDLLKICSEMGCDPENKNVKKHYKENKG